MSLMKLLQQAQGGQGLAGLAQQLNMDEGQANQLAEMLAPAIGSAAKQRAESGGLDTLLGSLMGEGNANLFDDATQAASAEGQTQGQAFLDSLMGGREQAEALAGEAASRTGIDIGAVGQFLPAIAGMLQGGMQRNMPDSSIQDMLTQAVSGAAGGSKGGLGGLIGSLLGGGNKSAGAQSGPDLGGLMSMLDADGDGSPLDDILGKLMK